MSIAREERGMEKVQRRPAAMEQASQAPQRPEPALSMMQPEYQMMSCLEKKGVQM